MKTFDIALYYLKDIDFKIFPIIVKRTDEFKTDSKFNEAIKNAQQKFSTDKNNNKSNDYYRNICFATALYHLIFKAHDWTSFFDVACEIVEANKEVLNTKFEPYLGTEYPKIMLDYWIKYCEDLKIKTELIEGEIREELFFTAYHYIVEQQNNL
jgi:hypothetical protein